MGGFEPKNKFPEGEIGCQLCKAINLKGGKGGIDVASA